MATLQISFNVTLIRATFVRHHFLRIEFKFAKVSVAKTFQNRPFAKDNIAKIFKTEQIQYSFKKFFIYAQKEVVS